MFQFSSTCVKMQVMIIIINVVCPQIWLDSPFRRQSWFVWIHLRGAYICSVTHVWIGNVLLLAYPNSPRVSRREWGHNRIAQQEQLGLSALLKGTATDFYHLVGFRYSNQKPFAYWPKRSNLGATGPPPGWGLIRPSSSTSRSSHTHTDTSSLLTKSILAPQSSIVKRGHHFLN